MNPLLPNDETWMRMALSLAESAALQGEVPVGALVVCEGLIVSSAFNLRETRQSPTAHAEILAIEQASNSRSSWRLNNATLYVTLEPCMMCLGAAILARIDTIVFGAFDPKGGACGSAFQLHDHPRLNHHPQLRSGVLAEESSQLLKSFFQARRS